MRLESQSKGMTKTMEAWRTKMGNNGKGEVWKAPWAEVTGTTYAWLFGVSCQPWPRLPQLEAEMELQKLEDSIEYLGRLQWSSESLLWTTPTMKALLSTCTSASQSLDLPMTCIVSRRSYFLLFLPLREGSCNSSWRMASSSPLVLTSSGWKAQAS